jgi:hypothetical protein
VCTFVKLEEWSARVVILSILAIGFAAKLAISFAAELAAESCSLTVLVEYDREAMDDMEKLERFVEVAIWCIQEGPSLTPTMRKVMHMLEGVVDVPIPPCPSPTG